MTVLRIYSEINAKEFENFCQIDEITKILREININIERWQPKSQISLEASSGQILEAYADQVNEIKKDYNFKGVDVISMNTKSKLNSDELKTIRQKFLDEHIHNDDEVRYFIEGQGLFCIHAANRVYQILCEAGDFISVPALTKHWFDMGSKPNFRCIRFFGEETGWIAEYTGDKIADNFPTMDQLRQVELLRPQ